MSQDLENNFQFAYNKAINYLSNRELSQLELEQKLIANAVAPTVVAQVIAQLIAKGYQSDARFAAAYVKMRIAKGYGLLYIRQALQQRGIEATLISATVAEFAPDWLQLARQARIKRFGTALPNNSKDYAKQSRFLYQRGFDYQQIRAALAD
jgi:regulatory protein